MSAAASGAVMVHSSPGRLRMKVPAHKHDRAFFQALAERIMTLDGVDEVRANPMTSRVLVLHEPARGDDILRSLAIGGVVELVAPGDVPTAGPQAGSHAEHGIDARGLLLAALVLLGTVQLVRGRALAPATTLFWMARELLRDRPERLGRQGR